MPRNPASKPEPGHERAYVRWTPSEYLAVAVNALPFIEQAYGTLDAFMKAQRLALKRDRWRGAEGISSQQVHTMREYEAKARALKPTERAAMQNPQTEEAARPKMSQKEKLEKGRAVWLEKVAAAKAAGEPMQRKAGVIWHTMENALVARALKGIPDGKFTTRVRKAMELVLPKDRWMSPGSISQACSAGGSMKRKMEEGAKNEWLLKEQEAKDAEAPAELSPPNVAPEPAVAGQLLARAGEGAPRVHSAFADASAAFAATISDAVGQLLQAHAAHLQQTLESRIGNIAQDVGLAIAAQIERGLRQTVVDTMAAELGGPVKAPAAAPAAPLPPVSAEPAKRVRFDVVGFEMGSHEQAVIQGLNGRSEKVDITFVHPDKFTTYAPHKGRNIIVVASRVPHSLKHKMDAARVEPTYVKRTPGHVVHAIEAICDSQGVPH